MKKKDMINLTISKNFYEYDTLSPCNSQILPGLAIYYNMYLEHFLRTQ